MTFFRLFGVYGALLLVLGGRCKVGRHQATGVVPPNSSDKKFSYVPAIFILKN